MTRIDKESGIPEPPCIDAVRECRSPRSTEVPEVPYLFSNVIIE